MKNAELIITLNDKQIIQNCLLNTNSMLTAHNKAKLEEELKNAQVLTEETIPEDVVKLNSFVHLQEVNTKKDFMFQLVLPGQVNINKKKFSVYAPMCIAVLGYRSGDVIEWEMPTGMKRYKIMSVMNM